MKEKTMKRKAKKTNGSIFLDDSTLAAKRMQAIEIAARLPEPEPAGGGMMAQSWTRPGKSAEKVIADATAIMAFVTKSA